MLLTLAPITIVGAASPNARHDADNLTFHGNSGRTGWYDGERQLAPHTLRSGKFGLLWESPPLGSAGETPPRLFASPLYIEKVMHEGATGRQRRLDIVYAASGTGFVAAINASARADLPAGSLLWQQQVTVAPCANGSYGILGTPVIDRARSLLYVVACEMPRGWSVHALDLASGREAIGWPLALTDAAINRPGINSNGANQFPSGVANLQRGALNLSANGARLLVTFGGEPVSGWLLAIDTRKIVVAGAFSMTARTYEGVGGLWSAGGPAVDSDGDIYVASGSSVQNALAGMGNAGVYPDSEGNWGQSIIRLATGNNGALRLVGSYTPFNYCQVGGQDIDLGSGTPILVDLPRSISSAPRLLIHAGSKQGNAYLLDRKRMPGGTQRRPPCATKLQADAERDGSMLAPEVQQQFGTRGPLNVFGPYSERYGMGDMARSRSTPAYFRDSSNRHFVFAAGTTKLAVDSPVNIAPGLVRLEITAKPGANAYLRVDAAQTDIVLQNPGAPVVSSNGTHNAIVWVLDVNKPRSASLYGDDPPKPVLYAIDAHSLALLWRSAPGQLHAGGKYNEPVVARGRVFVGTDRIQAFGLRDNWPVRAPQPAPKPAIVSMHTVELNPLAGSTQPELPPSIGEGLYRERCASCHEQDLPDIPARSQLRDLAPDRVVEKLNFGSMQGAAFGLSDAQIGALVLWLVGSNTHL